MGIILDLINFINKQKPAVSAQNLNQMQTNIQNAITNLETDIDNTYQKQLIVGEGINIDNGVISASKVKSLYVNYDQASSKTINLTNDKFTNYRSLRLFLRTNACYGYSEINTADINNWSVFQSSVLYTGTDYKFCYITFPSESSMQVDSSSGSDCWVCKVDGIF